MVFLFSLSNSRVINKNVHKDLAIIHDEKRLFFDFSFDEGYFYPLTVEEYAFVDMVGEGFPGEKFIGGNSELFLQNESQLLIGGCRFNIYLFELAQLKVDHVPDSDVELESFGLDKIVGFESFPN